MDKRHSFLLMSQSMYTGVQLTPVICNRNEHLFSWSPKTDSLSVSLLVVGPVNAISAFPWGRGCLYRQINLELL